MTGKRRSERPSLTRRLPQRIALGVLAALALSACVDSEAPLLGGGQPVFGERVRFQLFGLHDDQTHDPEIWRFRWDNSRYSPVAGKSDNLLAFTIHPFAGDDFVIQGLRHAKDQTRTEYALARKLAPGVLLVVAIDEDDSDPATRARLCVKSHLSPCRVASKDALFEFARATAAKRHDHGGLAVRLAGEK